MTSSLRGMLTGNLRVEIVKEGVHSGHATGIVPSTFRIARQLIDRIENVQDGTIIKDFHTTIPPHRIEQAKYVPHFVVAFFCLHVNAGTKLRLLERKSMKSSPSLRVLVQFLTTSLSSFWLAPGSLLWPLLVLRVSPLCNKPETCSALTLL